MERGSSGAVAAPHRDEAVTLLDVEPLDLAGDLRGCHDAWEMKAQAKRVSEVEFFFTRKWGSLLFSCHSDLPAATRHGKVHHSHA